MKKSIFIIFVSLLFVSCSSDWEYKIVTVQGEKQETTSKFQANNFNITDETLNFYGKDGWELVGVYEKIETVHPNFGNEDYVTGLQPNVRTSELNFVFKREK